MPLMPSVLYALAASMDCLSAPVLEDQMAGYNAG